MGEEKKVTSTSDFTTDHLFKKMVLFTIPLLLLSAAQLVFYSLDQLIVSNFGGGQTSFAAVSCNNFIVTLLIGSFIGISVGANIVLARYLGKKDLAGAQRTVQTSLILAVIIGTAVAIIGIPLSRYILIWMSTPEVILNDATVYLECCFGGMPFLMIFNFGAACFRAVGDGKRPLIVITGAGIINVCLNLLFVLGFGMKTNGRDVFGVGLATVISQFIQAVAIIWLLAVSKNPYCHLYIKGLRLYRAETRRVLRNGLMAGLQVFVFSISNVVIQKSVNSYSDANITNLIALNGNAAAVQLENYISMINKAIGVAVVVMTAQNRGSHNKANLKKTIWMSIASTTVVSLVLGGLVILLYRPLVGLFLPSSAFASVVDYELSMEVAHRRLVFILPLFALEGLMEVTSAYCRGLGHPYAPTVVTFFTATVYRLIFIFAIWNLVPAMHTLTWLWSAWPISWGLAVLVYWTFMPSFIKKTFNKIDQDKAEEAKTVITEEN
jgi:putative MATE family efflux protein